MSAPVWCHYSAFSVSALQTNTAVSLSSPPNLCLSPSPLTRPFLYSFMLLGFIISISFSSLCAHLVHLERTGIIIVEFNFWINRGMQRFGHPLCL